MAVMCTLPFGTSLLFAVKCFKLLALAEATASGRKCAVLESLQSTMFAVCCYMFQAAALAEATASGRQCAVLESVQSTMFAVCC